MGGWEVYRKSQNGTLELERETLHMMDDERRIALVDTLTFDSGNVIISPIQLFRFQLDNHLNSAGLELDETAAVISYEEYYPFGTTSYRSGRTNAEIALKRYRYVGKERDDETGLYYYGARYYAGWLARFVSVDPLAEQFPHLTPFQYASNDPIGAIDIDGLESTKEQEKSNTIGKEKEQQAESKLVPEDLITANRIATEAIARFGNNIERSAFWVDVLRELVGINTEPKRKRTEQTEEFVAQQVDNLYWSSNERRSQFITLLNQIYSEAQYLSKVNPALYNAYNEAIQSGDIGGALGLILGRSLEVSKRQQEFFALSLIIIAYGAAFPATAGAGGNATSRGFFVTNQRFRNNLLTKITPESLTSKSINFETISSAEVLEQVIARGQADRVIGNYSIDLIANRSANKYIVNGFNVNLRAGASESVSGIKSVLAELESEALASGANKFIFRLHAVRNPSFASERLWNLLGYSFKNEGGNIITVTKLLK
ncbi:hypothetical protein FNH22_31325 [Fulvivirga sp. M361]|uniref:RHS repeat domain-containing protein n=1 Tax=Fulvivirga sp. M361 TaxID=2594266 RepID=UPI00117AF8B8|nr:RHS repeat-associated core domain-containing protein [Fulvivirga sp. M361]TRX45812.1 hypothetical protein FNH22_31325 [Fulvivirga sp. M361]